MKNYVLYADESVQNGPHFGNFYGGVLVESKTLPAITRILDETKRSCALNRELKWTRVTAQFLGKYDEVIKAFFVCVGTGDIKVRIMFTQNRNVPIGLTRSQRVDEYTILYYQFIKHAFGFPSSEADENKRILLNLDNLPVNREQAARFKNYLSALSYNPGFRDAGVFLQPQDIAEVDSRKHVVLQCLDVVLGSMQFRLNDRHKAVPENQSVRAGRTVAKEKLYRSIRHEIGEIAGAGFNIGISTGDRGDIANRWRDPYRHWLFVPKGSIKDFDKKKRRK